MAISEYHFFCFCACTLPRRAPPFELSSSVRDDPGQYVYLRRSLCAPSKLLKPTCQGWLRGSISRDLAQISILGDRGRLNLDLGIGLATRLAKQPRRDRAGDSHTAGNHYETIGGCRTVGCGVRDESLCCACTSRSRRTPPFRALLSVQNKPRLYAHLRFRLRAPS